MADPRASSRIHPGGGGPTGGDGCETGGTSAKLYAGGGEVVAHSSVQACHGLSPAIAPLLRLM